MGNSDTTSQVDSTIIQTKSGNRFPKDADDWEWFHPSVPKTLRALHEAGGRAVFFSNQHGDGPFGPFPAAKEPEKEAKAKAKFESILRQLKVPVIVFSSIGNSQYRKPNIGGWELYEREWNKGVKVDLAKSTFVGDAAGRPAGSLQGKKKADHSCCDRMAAANIGVPFHTPEEFFFKQAEAAYGWGQAFDARTHLTQLQDPPTTTVAEMYSVLKCFFFFFPGGGGRSLSCVMLLHCAPP